MSVVCMAKTGALPDARENCIVSENAIGCLSERTLAEITQPRSDPADQHDAIEARLRSGMCRLFDYGERVVVTATDRQGTRRKAVRRPGDPASYWMPASWSRPAHECRDDASVASLRRKIGMDSRSTIRFAEDTTEPGEPYWQREPAMTECTIKPVMTNAEIAACRAVRR